MFQGPFGRVAGVFALAAIVLIGARGEAIDYSRRPPGGGAFNDASLWSPLSPPGPTGSGNSAIFDLGSSSRYTVTGASGNNSSLFIRNDRLTLDVANYSTVDLIVEGDDVGDVVFTGSSSSLLESTHTLISNSPVRRGIVEVRVIGWINSSLFSVGRHGRGDLLVHQDADVITGAFTIGEESNSVGNVTVNGAGALLATTGNLVIGSMGQAALTIEKDSDVNVPRALVGVFPTSVATAKVTGAGSTWNITNRLDIGGDVALNQPGGQGTVIVENGGQIFVSQDIALFPGGVMRLAGGNLITRNFDLRGGRIDWTGGALRLTGAGGLTIGATGLLGPMLLLNAQQALAVDHGITIDPDATLFSAGPIVTVDGLTNHGDLILSETAMEGPVGHLAGSITALGNVAFNGLVTGSGQFFGPGAIAFNGGYMPGASPAAVEFEGDVSLGDNNTLVIELGGLTPGVEYDRLDVGGVATLDGALEVRLINGFTPAVGDAFGFLFAAGGLAGLSTNWCCPIWAPAKRGSSIPAGPRCF